MESVRQYVKIFLGLLILVLFARFFFQLGYSNGYATAEILTPRRGIILEPVNEVSSATRPSRNITVCEDDDGETINSPLAAAQMSGASGS